MVKKNIVQESFLGGIGSSLGSLNNSKFFAGVMMIMLNVGSKYIKVELTKSQERFLQKNVFRQVMVFAILWMGTKDVITALIMTGIFHVLANHLLNEQSNFCIIPEKWRQFEEVLDLDGDGKVTEAEIKKAKEILEKAKRKEVKRERLRNMNNFKISL